MKLPVWLVILLGIFAVASGLLLLAAIFLSQSWDLQGQATSYHVVDGNTLVLEADGRQIRMDLAFVDTPPPIPTTAKKPSSF